MSASSSATIVALHIFTQLVTSTSLVEGPFWGYEILINN
jgi:hypothetical protein